MTGAEATILSVVLKGVDAAWKIYNLGFSKVNSAPVLYVEFGVAILGLRKNLISIKTIVENAQRQLTQRSIRDFGPDPFDLSAFNQIVGNYNVTLRDCETLLKDKKRFRHDHQGCVYNIIWNMDIDPQTLRLKDRIAFHNVKILMVMQTLEIKMLADIEKLILELHQDQSERLRQIEEKLDRILDGPALSDQAEPSASSGLGVPSELSEKFQGVAFGNNLKQGLDAFFRHYKQQIVTLEASSYLDLMKSVWIMDRLMASDDYKTEPGGLYDRCVREMNRRLRRELDRIKKERIPAPEISVVLQLPEEDFQIWTGDLDEEPEDDIASEEVLLTLSLPSKNDCVERTLRVLRNADSTIRVEDATVNTTRTGTITHVKEKTLLIDFGLPQACLIPLYMYPRSPSSVLSLTLRGVAGGVGITPTFKDRNDLLAFQSLIVGYSTVGQIEGITVTYPGHSPVVAESKGKGKQKDEYLRHSGKLQMWRKNLPEDNLTGVAKSGTGSGSAQSGTSPGISQTSLDGLGRRVSDGTISNSTLLSSRRGTIYSAMSNTPSSHTTQVSIGKGKIATESHLPEPYLLILYLEQNVKAEDSILSFLVITIDDVVIERTACEGCRKGPNCLAAVIQRKGGFVSASLYSTQTIKDWNLATMGAFWKPGGPKSSPEVHKIKLPWLAIEFGNLQERLMFDQRFDECRSIYHFKLQDHFDTMQDLRRKNINIRS